MFRPALRTASLVRATTPLCQTAPGIRTAATVSTADASAKREGDISDAFASLSGLEFKALDSRYAHLKTRLVSNRQDRIAASWVRLLAKLREEIPLITALGPAVIPEIDYKDLDRGSEPFSAELRKRGLAVIRGVFGENEAVQMKHDILDYVRRNPHTKAFPPDNPQVYELYWSSAQLRARSDPRLLKAQRFLLQHWHSRDPDAHISLAHPTVYADRLRIRQPGDNKFALGPHVDGGSVERWEEGGYGLGGVYEAVFDGRWEELDSWEASCRLPVKSDLYNGAGACSVFRALQGWVSMSETGPREGTLLVNPLLGVATAYYLLRPFFAPRVSDPQSAGFLEAANWRLQDEADSWLHGATPGHGQELRAQLHPHLQLDKTMVHAPRVRPGDYVAWHCDTIHAVDTVHQGAHDSSVLYIPACPLTEQNAAHLAKQRDCFLRGVPSPDFPGGLGESEHAGRWSAGELGEALADGGGDGGASGLQAFGLRPWDAGQPGLSRGQRAVVAASNRLLGF